MSGMPNNLFHADIMLPSQFFAMLGSRAPSKKGECRLLIAVLQDAVDCFQKHATTGDRVFEEAERWIMETPGKSNRDAHAPRFSFEFICAVLDIDAEYLRRGLRRWREAQAERSRVEASADAAATL